MSDDDTNDGEIHQILQNLTARERAALRSRFGSRLGEDCSLEDVARQFDVTRQRIRDIERKARTKLGTDVSDISNELACSFCGKYKSEVVKMVEASSGARICGACIEDCLSLLQDEDDEER